MTCICRDPKLGTALANRPPHLPLLCWCGGAGLQNMVISVGLVLYLGFYRRSLDLG